MVAGGETTVADPQRRKFVESADLQRCILFMMLSAADVLSLANSIGIVFC